MKALKLSSIALCVFALVSSCTKDSIQTSTSSSSSLETVLGTSKKGGTDVQPNGVGNSQNNGNNGVVKTTATVNYTVTPAIASLTDNVTIGGTITFAAPVDQFVYGVEVTKKDADGNWVAFPVAGMNESINLPAGQTITSKDFSFSFLASTWGAGEYQIVIHVGGQDVENMFSEVRTLVIKSCEALNLKGALTKVTPLGGSLYEFEVTYSVTSCPAMGAAHLQGGLTAVTGLIEENATLERYPLWTSDATAKGQVRKNTNNDNHIIMWDFQIGEGYSNTFKVTFTKELKGTAPYQLTGQWSVSAINPKTGLEEKPTAAPITYNP